MCVQSICLFTPCDISLHDPNKTSTCSKGVDEGFVEGFWLLRTVLWCRMEESESWTGQQQHSDSRNNKETINAKYPNTMLSRPTKKSVSPCSSKDVQYSMSPTAGTYICPHMNLVHSTLPVLFSFKLRAKIYIILYTIISNNTWSQRIQADLKGFFLWWLST